MIEIPCFWYSRPSKYEFIVSDSPENGFNPSPMHYHNGVLYETMRISKYNLSSTYTSQTGESPRIKTNMNTFRTNVRGKGQYLLDYPSWCSLVMLMLVKYANMDIQSVVGAGKNSGKATSISGGTDNVLGLDGSATSISENESVLTLGIENFYGNVFKFIDGTFAYGGNLYTKDIQSVLSDPVDTAELQGTYNMVQTSYVNGANTLVKDIAYDNQYDYMIFPIEGGSPSPSNDRFFSNANFNCLVVGGSAWNGATNGLFCLIVLAVGNVGNGGGALAIEFGEPLEGGDTVSISFENLTEYDRLMRNDLNVLKRSTPYILNSIVNKGQVFLKCTQAGTTDSSTLSLSGVSVGNTLTDGTVRWEVISITGIPESSVSGISSWVTGISYVVGDLVINNNKIYSCNTAHTSTTFASDIANWTEISASITHIDDWVASTAYVQGDLVAHSAKIYRCITSHTSESNWNSTEEGNWEELSPTINEITTWSVSTAYAQNQIVIYNDCLYICNIAHTSTATFDDTKWTVLGYEIATTIETVEAVFGGVPI